jgi:catechol 2,3-dioxygenase
MGVTTHDMFGDGGTQTAPTGSYGTAPAGYRLPTTTQLGPVQLQVSNLDQSLAYYEAVLGMRVVGRDAAHATLAPQDEERVLLGLHSGPGVRPAPGRGRLGLYHFAILLPDRPSLGRFVRHLSSLGVRAGAADHLVSEALYLHDPDGLGIEVYADRPPETWRRVDRELIMATDPLDHEGLLRSAGNGPWRGMPPATQMGHLHLHVGDLARAAAFYSDALGLDRIVWRYPGALFLSAGGYHHHLGTNTWAGPSASPPPDDEARLIEWTIEVPTINDLRAAAASLSAAGGMVDDEGEEGRVVRDPWKTQLRLRLARQ